MFRKTFVLIAVVVVFLISTVGPAAAQDEPPPPDNPDAQFLTHPVVKVLSEYFGRDTGDVNPDEPVDPALPPVEPVTPETIAAEIAAYHEDGMGFGVLVKLYAMAEASREACQEAAEGETCEPLLVDDLVNQFKSGVGMGALFKEHGKPALLGVGHVKKELKNLDQDTDTDEQKDKDDKTKDNKPEKKDKDKGKKK